MKRRDFITKAGVGVAAGVAGAATLSAPAIADGHKELNIVSTWPCLLYTSDAADE